MGVPSQPGGIAIEVDSRDWYKLTSRLKQLEDGKQIVSALRKRLRGAGDWAVKRIQHNLDLPSPDTGPDDGRMRDLLKAATKVSISFSSRQAGAKVVTSEAKVPAEHRGIIRVYNKETFRHPIFGDTDHWVNQRGRPFFAEAFEAELVALTRKEVEAAIDEAWALLNDRT